MVAQQSGDIVVLGGALRKKRLPLLRLLCAPPNFAIGGMTEAFRREVRAVKAVGVTLMLPGIVETEFQWRNRRLYARKLLQKH